MYFAFIGLALAMGSAFTEIAAANKRKRAAANTTYAQQQVAAYNAQVLANFLQAQTVMAWPGAKSWTTIFKDSTGGFTMVASVPDGPGPAVDRTRYTMLDVAGTNMKRMQEAAADGYKLAVSSDGRVLWVRA